jgi:hypothetical protein
LGLELAVESWRRGLVVAEVGRRRNAAVDDMVTVAGDRDGRNGVVVAVGGWPGR